MPAFSHLKVTKANLTQTCKQTVLVYSKRSPLSACIQTLHFSTNPQISLSRTTVIGHGNSTTSTESSENGAMAMPRMSPNTQKNTRDYRPIYAHFVGCLYTTVCRLVV